MRGLYLIKDLPSLIPLLTEKEKKWIRKCCERDIYYFNRIFTKEVTECYNNFKFSYLQLSKNREILLREINKYKGPPGKLTWYWPKGKITKNDEDTFITAMREFKEEIEINFPKPCYISRNIIRELLPTNYLQIENKLWVCIYDKEFDIGKIMNNYEVNDKKWFSMKEVIENGVSKELLDMIIESFTLS